MKKILIVATVQSHVAQFHQYIINMLKDEGYEVHVAAKDNLSVKGGLKLYNVDKLFDIPFERSPFKKQNVKAYKELKKVIIENDYDLIQCNTPVGGILTRLAARTERKKGCKVLYMAHGFHFYKGASIKNWITYYPIEKLFARFTDTLITINNEDFALAKRKFKCQTAHIHGIGVSRDKYYIHSDAEKSELRKAYGLSDDYFVIVCVGELNKNKDQTTLIKAINNIKNECVGIKLLLAGNGPYDEALKALVKELKLDNYISFLGYTRNLPSIVPFCDLLVSCSHREGLPLNIIEAMISGIPVVASKNRGHNELVIDGKNGFKFDPADYEQCGRLIQKLYTDREQLKMLAENAPNSVEAYMNENVIQEIKAIYLK